MLPAVIAVLAVLLAGPDCTSPLWAGEPARDCCAGGDCAPKAKGPEDSCCRAATPESRQFRVEIKTQLALDSPWAALLAWIPRSPSGTALPVSHALKAPPGERLSLPLLI